MCGIAGLYSFKKEPVDRSLLSGMNDLLTHRGPDADGLWTNGHVGLAMRRLKVIDLSTGDQPIHDGQQKLWIVFNGEIYNYRELRKNLESKGHKFYTKSDTEVILHQFMEEGKNCVQSLIGMFAFAIYDSSRDSLFIARDRLGIKPLFYAQKPEGLAFASELKSLLEIPWVDKSVDAQAVSHYLSMNYLPSPWTPVAGIRQLPPGHWLEIENNRINVQEYWDIPCGDEREESETAALKKIEELLHRSMERRLIADVPIGAFLSGGLDSSTLVWLMKERGQKHIKTFSVGFEDASYDETPFAREIANYFGTDHHEIHCGARDVQDHIKDIAWHADGLLADQAALPLYTVSKLAKQHVTVCLSGDGGDEIFIGYPTFNADRYHSLYSKIPSFIRKAAFEPLTAALPSSSEKVSFDYRAKKFVEAGGFSNEKAHYWWRTIFTDSEKARLLNGAYQKNLSLDGYLSYETAFSKARGKFIQRCLYADLKVWLGGNNLYKVDSMTMAHGLEARVPFLDHELVEYMMHLPASLKFRGNQLKYLLKKFLIGKLPTRVLARKKAGWHTPIAGWFRKDLKAFLNESFSKAPAGFYEIFNRNEVETVVRDHEAGRRNNSFKIWGLLIFRNWLESFQGKINHASLAAR